MGEARPPAAGEPTPSAGVPVIRRLKSCLAGVGCVTVLAAAVTGGWLYRERIVDLWERWTDGAPAAAVEVSEELAARTERRVAEALASAGPAEVRLTAPEVESLVRYRAAALPPGVSEPSVLLADSSASASAMVDVERVVGDRLPDMIRRMVGDSARVTVRVVPRVPRPGVLRLEVRELQAGAVGLPPVMLPWLLAQMGVPLSQEDPRAMELEVGRGLTGAEVRDSTLVLTRGATGRG